MAAYALQYNVCIDDDDKNVKDDKHNTRANITANGNWSNELPR